MLLMNVQKQGFLLNLRGSSQLQQYQRGQSHCRIGKDRNQLHPQQNLDPLETSPVLQNYKMVLAYRNFPDTHAQLIRLAMVLTPPQIQSL